MEINKSSVSSNEQEPKTTASLHSKNSSLLSTTSPSTSTLVSTIAAASVDSTIKSFDRTVQRDKQKTFQLQKSKDSSSSNGSVDSNSIAKVDDNPAIKFKYSRTHQKRFHRRFPTIGSEEQLIDCESFTFI